MRGMIGDRCCMHGTYIIGGEQSVSQSNRTLACKDAERRKLVPVDVLLRTDSLCNLSLALGIHMIAQRQLHQYPTNTLISIQPLHLFHDLFHFSFSR